MRSIHTNSLILVYAPLTTLQVHIKDATEDLPQTFVKISRNDYDTFPEGEKHALLRCTVPHFVDALARLSAEPTH
jgi:hypothetical protein